MAEFTAKDVQALRQATGAGMMDARRRSRRTTATWRRPSSGCARRAWPSRRSAPTARTRRAQSPSRSSSDGAAHRRAQVRDRLRRQVRAVHRWSRTTSPTLVLAEGDRCREPAVERPRRPEVTLKENIELGRVVRFEAAAGNVLDTYLHIQERPRRERRARRASTAARRAGPRHRGAHRVRQAAVPHAGRGARRRRRRGARRRSRPSPATRASPSRRWRRSSRAGSTAGSRSMCSSSSRSRRTTSRLIAEHRSATPSIVRFAQVEIGA